MSKGPYRVEEVKVVRVETPFWMVMRGEYVSTISVMFTHEDIAEQVCKAMNEAYLLGRADEREHAKNHLSGSGGGNDDWGRVG